MELPRRCDFCAKTSKSGRSCKILTEMIGLDRDCWCWSDDPTWEAKAEAAIKAYAEKHQETAEKTA